MWWDTMAKATTTRQRELTGHAIGFWNFKVHRYWQAFSNEATPPNPSLIVLPTGDQTFKYESTFLSSTARFGILDRMS